jgi:hypothetical protein
MISDLVESPHYSMKCQSRYLYRKLYSGVSYHIRYRFILWYYSVTLRYRFVLLDMAVGIWVVPLNVARLCVSEEVLVFGNLPATLGIQ